MVDSTRIRVMTVDDHEIMRGGIRIVLLAFDDIELVAEARGGDEALRLCHDAEAEVVLMDMKMPEMDGIATTRALKAAQPEVQILILTSFHDHNLVRRAMEAGAVGYLLKDTSKEALAEAIRSAKVGKTTLSPEAAVDLHEKDGKLLDTAHDLTARECEVLGLLAQGLSNNQIAEQLERSPFTVRQHVSQIIAKLGAANRAEAAAIAVEHGVIDRADLRN
jgi:NarL family two-component system response regulator LiaR